MDKSIPSKTDDNENSDKPIVGAQQGTNNSEEHPIKLLLQMATDDNVETSAGTEIQVDNARSSSDNKLLTKTELQKYQEYKSYWADTLKHPQESFDALERREKQIIEAANNHDWEKLDKLKSEVDSDLERIKFIFNNIGSDYKENS